MTKNPKMRVCRNCNTEIAAKAKKCPACGARQKPPFYQRGWFIVLVIIAVLGIVGSGIRKNTEKNEEKAERANEYRWPDSQLAGMVPKPDSKYGRIISESESSFYINIYEISGNQFEDYVEECKDAGFTVDYSRQDSYYLADDGEGYSLSLVFDEDREELTISLRAPESGETEGSATDSEPGETESNTPESDGRASEPSEEETGESGAELESAGEAPDGMEEAESTDTDSSGLVDGMRPEFKEAMDSYEAFYDEYCEFLQQYADNASDVSLLAEYMEFLNKAGEMEEKFEAWEGDMNDDELKYYTEVHLRISQKLLETTTEM